MKFTNLFKTVTVISSITPSDVGDGEGSDGNGLLKYLPLPNLTKCLWIHVLLLTPLLSRLLFLAELRVGLVQLHCLFVRF